VCAIGVEVSYGALSQEVQVEIKKYLYMYYEYHNPELQKHIGLPHHTTSLDVVEAKTLRVRELAAALVQPAGW
jgi:hypothetical protein